MKKEFILMFLAVVLSVSFAAAATLPAPPIAMSDITNFLSGLLTGQTYGVDLMGRLLIFLLLTVILYRASEKVVGEEKGTLALSIAVIVSLIAVRFLTNAMVRGIMLPYSSLGIVLSILFPFILFSFFVETSDLSKPMRRIGWVLMIIVFLVLWYTRWTDIGDLAWIYLIAAVASLTMLLLDGTIRRFAVQTKIAKSESTVLNIEIDEAQRTINDLYERLQKAVTPAARNAILQKLKTTEANLKELTKKVSEK